MADVVDRLNEALAGRYRIERELGEGGMATVYLAHDVRHDRQVAIKVLRPELAAVVGAERFLAEIRTTAALQHPHILALHDSGEAGGFLFYVMPYVEGESLRERLERERQLPVDEAVELARKVADALDYAHERGVVHRDVKPANVLLSERGEPLVADFGIALALSEAGEGRITETGLSLGTPHYMSPEQATGERMVDRRTDVYALGCVLYEMLVGEPPHGGSTAQAVLARILTGDPQRVREVRPTVPPNVEAVVTRALEKLPADRFSGAAPFAEALDDPGFRYVRSSADTPEAIEPREAPSRSRAVLAGLGAAVVTVVAAFLVGRSTAPEPDQPVTRLSLDLGELESVEGDVVISPDGRRLAVAAEVDGERAIWTRRLDEPAFRPIPGTEDGRQPTFSPDGDWVVFRDERDGTLAKAPVSGGGAVTLVDDPSLTPFFPQWGDAGQIVFVAPQVGLHLVSETGADLHRVPNLGSGRAEALPGGDALVVWPIGTTEIRYADLDADTSWVVVPNGTHPRYVPTGHLLYAPPNGGLFALPFDPASGRATGEAVRVLDRVATRDFEERSGYDVSANGTLVYREGEAEVGGGPDMLFLLMSRTGATDTLRLPPQWLGRPRFSPDGGAIAYEVGPNPTELHTFDLTTGRTTPLTSGGDNDRPVWSPDGTRIVFNSVRAGTDNEDLFVMPVSGGPATLLLSQPGPVDPSSWSSNGIIGFEREDPGEFQNGDLWILSLPDDREPLARPWLEAPWSESELHIAPDGTLAAYESDESGLPQVYVRTFPEPTSKWTASEPGRPALAPRWSPDGDHLYFWTVPLDGPRVLHQVRVERNGDDLSIHSPQPVLEAPSGAQETNPRGWDIHPDGERFLVTTVVDPPSRDDEGGGPDQAEEDRYVVILNWLDDLREQVGGEG